MFRLDRPPTLLALLLVVLAPVLGGCIGGDGGASAAPLVAERTAAPGTAVSFPLAAGDANLTNASFQVVEDGGLQVSLDGRYATVTLAGDAGEGDHEILVEASGGELDVPVQLALTLHVRPASDPVAAGDVVNVSFVGRTADGGIFVTNHEDLANSTLPKADIYQPPRSFEPAPFQAGPGGRVLPALGAALVGMDVGHSVSVQLEPWEAFGNDTVTEPRDRVTTVERNRTMQRTFEGPLRIFGGLISEDTQEGDILEVPIGGSTFPYNVTHLNDTHAAITLAVEVNETYTHVSAWPNSSVVVEVNETHASFRVDPPASEGETVTYHPYWPDASTIVAITATEIRVEHSPAEGTTFTEQSRRGPVEYTVVEVGPNRITVERANPSPLAGQPVIFDLTVESVRSGP